jgi:hypothetical protein
LVCQQEYTISTKLTVLCLVEWTSGLRCESYRDTAFQMLSKLIDMTEGHGILAAFEPLRSSSNEDDIGECEDRVVAGKCCHQVEIFSIVSLATGPSSSATVTLMRELMEKCRSCPRCCLWLGRVLSTVVKLVESPVVECTSDFVQEHPEGVMHPRGAKRCRRLDPVVLEHIAIDMVASGRYRSAAKAAKATGQLNGTTARYAEAHVMTNYVWSSARVFHDVAYLSVVNDDVRAGGEKNQFGAVWSSEKQLGAWLVPQVLERIKFEFCSMGCLGVRNGVLETCPVWDCAPKLRF